MIPAVILCEGNYQNAPYGVDLLQLYGIETSGVFPLSGKRAKKIRDVLEHRSGVKFSSTIRAIPKIHGSELMVGLLEPYTEFAARMKAKGIPPFSSTPLVMISCWLAEWIRTGTTERVRELVSIYSAVDLILVLSSNQVKILAEAGFDPDKVAAVPFGYSPGDFADLHGETERDLDVVAAGFDRGRDYETFLRGVSDLDTTVHIVCGAHSLEGLEIPKNVVVHGRLPYQDYKSIIRRAKIVAVPTHELAYPTGQSVTLDAMALGAAVALTETEALGEYFDSSCAALVPVGDASEWHKTLTDLLRNDDRREQLAQTGTIVAAQRFTTRNMWDAVVREMVSHGLFSEHEVTWPSEDAFDNAWKTSARDQRL